MDWRREMLIFCFALLTAVNAQKETNYCLPNLKGWTSENIATQRCYEFVSVKADRKSWSEARDYCQLNGGRLINIENSAKQKMMELFMSSKENTYKPDVATYDPLNNKTWNGYDPDVWIGATRDSDGSTWRFDQYTTSRTVRSVIVTWFNYGSDQKLIKEQNADKNRYTSDTCLFMRFTWKKVGKGNSTSSYRLTYPWYQHQLCSSSKGHKHPFICEYEGYKYRGDSPTSSWLIVIAVLGVFVSCGFIACTIYCLWDKIHTSYNVLQI